VELEVMLTPPLILLKHRLIDDITFEQAQNLLDKNKKAPARAKTVEENYSLTTKLFCGHCYCAMTGGCGTSASVAIVRNPRHNPSRFAASAVRFRFFLNLGQNVGIATFLSKYSF